MMRREVKRFGVGPTDFPTQLKLQTGPDMLLFRRFYGERRVPISTALIPFQGLDRLAVGRLTRKWLNHVVERRQAHPGGGLFEFQ